MILNALSFSSKLLRITKKRQSHECTSQHFKKVLVGTTTNAIRVISIKQINHISHHAKPQ